MPLCDVAYDRDVQMNPAYKTSLQTSGVPTSRERRRTQIACARCRKRKIKCSGDPGDGSGCLNCKQSGVEVSQCVFGRVGSVPQLLRNTDPHDSYACGDQASAEHRFDANSKTGPSALTGHSTPCFNSGIAWSRGLYQTFVTPAVADTTTARMAPCQVAEACPRNSFLCQKMQCSRLSLTEDPLQRSIQSHSENDISHTKNVDLTGIQSRDGQRSSFDFHEMGSTRQLPAIPCIPSSKFVGLDDSYQAKPRENPSSVSRVCPYTPTPGPKGTTGVALRTKTHSTWSSADDIKQICQQAPISHDPIIPTVCDWPVTSSEQQSPSLDTLDPNQSYLATFADPSDLESSFQSNTFPTFLGFQENAYDSNIDFSESLPYQHKPSYATSNALVNGQEYMSPYHQRAKSSIFPQSKKILPAQLTNIDQHQTEKYDKRQLTS